MTTRWLADAGRQSRAYLVALAPEDRPCPGVAVRSASMTAALSHKASPPMEDQGYNLPIVC